VRSTPPSRLRLRWAPGARLEEQPVVMRNILRLRPTVVSESTPAGVESPDLDLDRLFPLVAAGKALPAVVDDYLAAAGRRRERRQCWKLPRLVDGRLRHRDRAGEDRTWDSVRPVKVKGDDGSVSMRASRKRAARTHGGRGLR
jgi:hypothetical protein